MLQKAKVANFVPRSSIIFPAYADLSHSPPSWNSWIDNQFLNGYKSLRKYCSVVCRSLQRADVAFSSVTCKNKICSNKNERYIPNALFYEQNVNQAWSFLCLLLESSHSFLKFACFVFLTYNRILRIIPFWQKRNLNWPIRFIVRSVEKRKGIYITNFI